MVLYSRREKIPSHSKSLLAAGLFTLFFSSVLNHAVRDLELGVYLMDLILKNMTVPLFTDGFALFGAR